MPTTTIAIILIGLFVLLLIVWLVRSRGNTTGHIDTTLTAVGAATEAVEDIVEVVKHKVEEARLQEETASAEILAAGSGTEMVVAGIVAAERDSDDLSQLKGVGPKLVALLSELGVTRFDQIAAWTPDEIEAIDARLGTFKGRIARDNWIEQAAFLAKGDIAGFEAKFGKLNG
jgi:predicted flap endonuclease-1-like 5' DNA nuclease